MIVAVTILLWIFGDSQRTLFGVGEDVKVFELEIQRHQGVFERDNLFAEEDRPLKDLALKYLEIASTQNEMIRLLINFGFLGFLFANGMFGFLTGIVFKMFIKRIERLIE